MARMRHAALAGLTALAVGSHAQIPDLLNALDAGGRAMGMGGGTNAADANTLSTYYNPAGLAYVSETTFTAVFRTFPESTNALSGNFDDPGFDTREGVGKRGLSHAGLVVPMKRGSLGFSFTKGGFVRDTRVAPQLSDPPLSVRNYFELLQAQSDFFTVAYGVRSGGANYGLGLILANQYVRNIQRYQLFDAGNNLVDTVAVDNSGNANGFGLIGGVQWTPDANPNLAVGLSVRTPIDLRNNAQTEQYYDRIPGRASLAVAARTDQLNSGGDFIAYGVQVDYFFGGQADKIFARRNYAVIGGGLEYNLHRWNARFPVRLGYQAVPSGGDGFSSRNALTFGIGYRPQGANFSFDLNFAAPAGGSRPDMALGVTYRSAR